MAQVTQIRDARTTKPRVGQLDQGLGSVTHHVQHLGAQGRQALVGTVVPLKGCSKFCRLSITGCGISSKAIVWPEKPGIIERQKHHMRNSLKMLDSLKWVVFGKDGPYARA